MALRMASPTNSSCASRSRRIVMVHTVPTAARAIPTKTMARRMPRYVKPAARRPAETPDVGQLPAGEWRSISRHSRCAALHVSHTGYIGVLTRDKNPRVAGLRFRVYRYATQVVPVHQVSECFWIASQVG